MQSLIEVFRMVELTKNTRIKIIIQLGKGINNTMGMNVTEPIVYELVKALDPNNTDVENEHYKRYIK